LLREGFPETVVNPPGELLDPPRQQLLSDLAISPEDPISAFDSWACPTCTIINEDANFACSMCGTKYLDAINTCPSSSSSPATASESSQAQSLIFERSVLEELFASTGGAAWKRKDGWLSEAAVGQWHGITTDEGGFITEIGLEENNLTGEGCDFVFSNRVCRRKRLPIVPIL
jgi:hypothetical protein